MVSKTPREIRQHADRLIRRWAYVGTLAVALVLVGIWTTDWRWVWTAIVLGTVSIIVLIALTMASKQAIEVAEARELDQP